jgi:hypothetical protein
MVPARPVGTRSQDKSLAAVAAFIASRLSGVGAGKREKWLCDAGLAVGRNGMERAGTHAGSALRPWLVVDEAQLDLGLEKALVVFPGLGRTRPELVSSVRRTGAVRQLFVMRSRRDVICVLVFQRIDKDDLFTAIEATGEAFAWEELIEDDRMVEAEMWTALMRRAAEREGLAQRSLERGDI